jgi:hypothetical protein
VLDIVSIRAAHPNWTEWNVIFPTAPSEPRATRLVKVRQVDFHRSRYCMKHIM